MDSGSARTALTRTTNWRKASYSRENGCIEVGSVPGLTGIRDSKLAADGAILAFTTSAFSRFINATRNGRFDPR